MVTTRRSRRRPPQPSPARRPETTTNQTFVPEQETVSTLVVQPVSTPEVQPTGPQPTPAVVETQHP